MHETVMLNARNQPSYQSAKPTKAIQSTCKTETTNQLSKKNHPTVNQPNATRQPSMLCILLRKAKESMSHTFSDLPISESLRPPPSQWSQGMTGREIAMD
jgi:hypothetical protein